jgi:hypothetical protein
VSYTALITTTPLPLLSTLSICSSCTCTCTHTHTHPDHTYTRTCPGTCTNSRHLSYNQWKPQCPCRKAGIGFEFHYRGKGILPSAPVFNILTYVISVAKRIPMEKVTDSTIWYNTSDYSPQDRLHRRTCTHPTHGKTRSKSSKSLSHVSLSIILLSPTPYPPSTCILAHRSFHSHTHPSTCSCPLHLLFMSLPGASLPQIRPSLSYPIVLFGLRLLGLRHRIASWSP